MTRLQFWVFVFGLLLGSGCELEPVSVAGSAGGAEAGVRRGGGDPFMLTPDAGTGTGTEAPVASPDALTSSIDTAPVVASPDSMPAAPADMRPAGACGAGEQVARVLWCRTWQQGPVPYQSTVTVYTTWGECKNGRLEGETFFFGAACPFEIGAVGQMVSRPAGAVSYAINGGSWYAYATWGPGFYCAPDGRAVCRR